MRGVGSAVAIAGVTRGAAIVEETQPTAAGMLVRETAAPGVGSTTGQVTGSTTEAEAAAEIAVSVAVRRPRLEVPRSCPSRSQSSPPSASRTCCASLAGRRGPPGSGKTYTAKLIKDQEVLNGFGSAPRILSLDDYFCTEKEKSVKDKTTGKTTTQKVMEYEYDKELEGAYRFSLNKAFRKTVDDGFFHFIILDCINARTEHYAEMSSYAATQGFKVYVAQMDMDVAACHKRNIHGRTLVAISEMVKHWEPTPPHYVRVDVRPLLQDDSIQEVEMEDTPAESAKEPEPEPPGEEESAVSKWEKMDPSEERLDKLDGVMHARKRKETQPQTMEDYLQLPDDYASRTTGSGNKKRVRWADLEEEMQQRKMRDVGFVVGQTDWSRMTDPTKGQSALTQTKYIPKVRSKK